MGRRRRSGQLAVGLDIGRHSLRLARLGGSPELPTLGLLATAHTPAGLFDAAGWLVSPDALAAALRPLVQEAGVAGCPAIFGVGGPLVICRLVPVPEPCTVEAALTALAATGDLPFPAREYRGTLDVETGADTALLVAAPRRYLDQLTLAVEEAGLRPMVADLTAFAAVYALAGQCADGQVRLVADWGSAGVTWSRLVGDRVDEAVWVDGGGEAQTAIVRGTLAVDRAAAEQLKCERLGVGEELASATAAAPPATLDTPPPAPAHGPWEIAPGAPDDPGAAAPVAGPADEEVLIVADADPPAEAPADEVVPAVAEEGTPPPAGLDEAVHAPDATDPTAPPGDPAAPGDAISAAAEIAAAAPREPVADWHPLSAAAPAAAEQVPEPGNPEPGEAGPSPALAGAVSAADAPAPGDPELGDPEPPHDPAPSGEAGRPVVDDTMPGTAPDDRPSDDAPPGTVPAEGVAGADAPHSDDATDGAAARPSPWDWSPVPESGEELAEMPALAGGSGSAEGGLATAEASGVAAIVPESRRAIAGLRRAIAEGLEPVRHWTAGEAPPVEILLHGGAARLTGLASEVARQSGVPTRRVTPAAAFGTGGSGLPASLGQEGVDLLNVLGLAWRPRRVED